MKFTLAASLLLSASAVLNTCPVAADFCGEHDSATAPNGYTIYNNLWGSSSATSGSQCTGLHSAGGNVVSWHTTWTWAGGPVNVKSFANANKVFTPKKVADIASMPSTMRYTYGGISGAVADVSYDIFLASTPGTTTSAYEIMIWLAAYGGASPISATGSAVATTSIAGYSWKLYQGYNGPTEVYSFVAVASPITNFSGDINLFFTYLVSNYSLPSSYYINTFQAGTEPFTGTNAKLNVSAFSVDIN